MNVLQPNTGRKTLAVCHQIQSYGKQFVNGKGFQETPSALRMVAKTFLRALPTFEKLKENV